MRKLVGIALAGMLLASAAGVSGAGPKGTLTPADYTEIQMLYARYNYAFDSSNPELYGGVFTTDGEFVIGPRTLKGRKEIGALAAGNGTVKERPKIFHISTNVLIDPSPEGATGSSYVTLIDLQKNPVVTGGGTYQDVIVKTSEGWRFKKRTYFAETVPAPPAPPKSNQ